MALTLGAAKMAADWYTPEGQKEESLPARFKLQGLTGRQWLEVMFGDGINTSGTLSAKQIQQALQYGLKGWEQINDEQGQALQFAPRHIDRLPVMLQVELAGEIINRSDIGEESEKNS